MAPPIPNRWTTHPEYIDLLNYIIQKTTDAKSPINRRHLAIEFKKQSGAVQTVHGLISRIENVRKRIHSFEHIDTNTKVKLMFALSASVDASFLKKMKKDAVVEFDNKIRITYYKANDGNSELRGDHSHSAKNRNAQLESKGSLRSLINSYFETKDNADAVPKSEEQKEMGNLIEFITEKCENVNSPLNIHQVTNDYIKKFGIARSSLRYRLISYCREIQNIEFLDTHSKVKQLFGLSATVDSDYLEKLRKDASVEVDGKNRITKYKAKDGSLELRGDHSISAKLRTAQFEYRKFIRNYYINKNNSDAVPKTKKEKEMWNLIEFITEKCENVNSPLTISQLAKDFNKHFRIALPSNCILYRVKRYCREIQKTEFMGTHSKVRQLFGLSATLNLEHLEKLRKTAVVEVDKKNRIIKYMSNNNSLTLRGGHWGSKTAKARRIEKQSKNNAATMSDSSEEESDNVVFNDSSDEYSSEEFGSEFDSDYDNDLLAETKHLTELSNETDNFDNETPARNCPPTEIPNGDNFDFDSSSERSHISEETEMKEAAEKENDSKVTENAVIKTRSGRLSKRRHLDSNFSYDLTSSSSSGVVMSSSSSYSKPAKHFNPPTERPHVSEITEMREDDGRERYNRSPTALTAKKKRSKGTTGFSSSKRTGSFLNNSMRTDELDDAYKNYQIDDEIKLEPFRGAIQENLNEIEKDEEIQQIPKPHQALDEHDQIEEVPIKIEIEEPVETKPESAHSSKLEFFEAMKSLIHLLDTPSLSWIH